MGCPADGGEVAGGELDGFGVDAVQVGPVVVFVDFGDHAVGGSAKERVGAKLADEGAKLRWLSG